MTINQILKDNPALGDYQVVFSQYFAIPTDEEGDLIAVTDFPVLGIATSDETQELRFVIQADDINLIRQAKNKVIHLVDQKLAEERDKPA